MTGSTGAGWFLDYPIDVGGAGSLRATDPDDHLRDLILQVLFTEPGERVNLPEFGCGIRRLVFAGNSDILRATTQFVIHQSLERWLGDLITVEQVDVTSDPGQEQELYIDISYVSKATGTTHELSAQT